MNKIILKIYDYLSAHRIVGASSFLIVTALLVLSFLNLGYKEDISDFLPLDKERQEALNIYQDISGANKIFALFECRDTSYVDYDKMVEAVDMFVEYLQQKDSLGYVCDLVYNVDETKITEITDFVYDNIPYFLTQEDYAKIDSAISQPEFVSSRLQQTKQLLMLPTGGLLTNNIQRDPLNIFSPVVSLLAKNSPEIAIDSYEGYILTPDSKKMVIMMTSPFGNSETDMNSKLVSLLDDAKKITIDNYPSIYIRVTGGPVIAVGNATQIKIDSIVSVILAIILILILLFYCFRNARNILLIVVSIAWGWLFAVAGLALFHDKISIIVVGISSVILGIAVNYPLHLISHLSHTTTIRSALKEIITPLLIGNVTTVCAFCTLIPLDSNALSDLGLFSAFLLIGTILFVIIYLPHIVKKRTCDHDKDIEQNDIFAKLSNISIDNNKYVFIGIIIITIILGYFSRNTSFDSNMSNINYMNEEQRENMAYFQTLTQGIDIDEQNIYVVSSDTTLDGALSKKDRVQNALENVLATDSTLHHTSSYRFVPSKEELQNRLASWNAFVKKNREVLLAELAIQMSREGFTDGSFDDFNKILNQEYSTSLDLSVLMPLFSSNFSCDSINKRYSVVDIISVPRCKTDSVENIVKETCHDQYCFNIQALNSTMSNSLSDNFGYIGWACGLIVFIFLWISFGRLEIALIAFCPMAISWIWILGLMGLFGIQFNIVNVILATFIFGQGDDYTIFITEGCMYEYAYRKKMLNSYRRSIIISALIMFIGIGALIFAKHPALNSLAQVTIVGMLTVVITSFVVPPLIFKWITTKKGVRRWRPLRLSASLRTVYCAVVWVGQLLIGYIVAGVMYIFGSRSLKSKRRFHKMISKAQRIDLNIIPGVKLNVINKSNEDFTKPSIIICNHQSMLDPAYLLALSPKILMVGNERSSLHPIMNGIFKWLNFYTVRKNNHKDWVDSCFERDLSVFKEYIQEGYSIAIFPEGVRNPKSNIVRYHKGPFYLAKELGVDILPIFIHGLNHVMPINSMEINSNTVTMVIESRISRDSELWNEDYAVTTKNIHKYYIKEYQRIAQTLETSNYYAAIVKDRYLYKGVEIYGAIKKHLKINNNYSELVDRKIDAENIVITGCGYGELPLLFALVHKSKQIYAIDADEAKLSVAKCSADGLVNNILYKNVLENENISNAYFIKLNENGFVENE